MTNVRQRFVFIALVSSHAITGVALAWLIDAGVGSPINEALLDALVYADAGLLAIWAGLGRHSNRKGFVGVGLGMTFLAALVAWALRHGMSGVMGPGNDFWTTFWLWLFQLALGFLAMSVVLAVLSWLRGRGIRLAEVASGQTMAEPAEIQFSLRQLMLLVLLVAVLVRVGPLVRAHMNDYRSYLSSLLAMSLGGLCLGTATLMAAWATLGRRATGVRACVALALAGSFGLLPPYYFPELFGNDFIASIAVFLVAELVTMASLHVVRWRRYRLVRKRDA